jgi:hypothetical protein
MSMQSNTANQEVSGPRPNDLGMRKGGRAPNLPRNAARAAGLKFYLDQPCYICGCTKRYVSNAECVDCAIAAGQARYAARDDEARANQKRRDHERYLRRCHEQNKAVRANIKTRSKALIADVLRYADDIAQGRTKHDSAAFAALVNEAITLAVVRAVGRRLR